MEVLLPLLFIVIVFVVVITFAQASEPLGAGGNAPRFSLADQDGVQHVVGEGPTVIFFLPRDDNSRCRQELADFSSAIEEFYLSGYRVLGVAVGTVDDHAAYARRNGVTIPLLADPSGKVARAYGAIIDFVVYRFAKRATFVVGAGGKIEKSFLVTEPAGHVAEVIDFVKSRGAAV